MDFSLALTYNLEILLDKQQTIVFLVDHIEIHLLQALNV